MTAGGLPLSGTPFQDLLPSSIKDDPTIAAAAKSLDSLLVEGDADTPKVRIWSRIDDLEEPLLSNLAHQMHLEGYEGWHLAETLEQKRRLIKAAYILHFYKGTRYSLERVFELLDMRGNVVEWWESGESIEDFPPYTFDIDVEGTRLIDEKFYGDISMLIYALKNRRSHLRKMRVSMTASGRTPVVASALMVGMTITVEPFKPRDVILRANVPVIAAGYQTLHNITLHPFGG